MKRLTLVGVLVALVLLRLFGPEEIRIGDTVLLSFDETVKDAKGRPYNGQ